jgi:hypothetical protein
VVGVVRGLIDELFDQCPTGSAEVGQSLLVVGQQTGLFAPRRLTLCPSMQALPL